MTRTRLMLGLVVVLCGSAVLTVHAQPRGYTPSQADSDNYRGKPCKDPWINIAYRLQDNTAPPSKGSVGACDPARYKNGHWQSFTELSDAIREARKAYFINRVQEMIIPTSAGDVLATYVNGKLSGSPLVGQDGASLIYAIADLIGKGGAGATAIVAAGGGNIVAAGGGNIVAAGGGNMREIAPGIFMRSVTARQ